MRALIVDDVALARDRVRRFLRDEARASGAEAIEVAGECADGREAAAAIARERPDLLFLDVQMPEVDGFGALRLARERGAEPLPVVIFTTAHDEFALRAFEVHALDYLLKPFPRERFVAAVARARRHIEMLRAPAQPHGHEILDRFDARLRSLLADVEAAQSRAQEPAPPAPEEAPLSRVAVRLEGRVLLVPVEEIDWIESAGNYVRLHAGAESHLVRETLSRLASRLDGRRFVRVHRGAIVNIERVRELRPLLNGDHKIVLRDGSRLPLSRSYAPRVLALLDSP